MADVTPKCRSITVFETMSEAKPTAVVTEVSRQATAMVRTVARPAQSRWSSLASSDAFSRSSSSR